MDQSAPIGPSTPPPYPPSDPVSPPGYRGSSKRKLLWFGCGGCAVVAMLALLFGGWTLLRLGVGVFESDVQAALRDNPVVIEHLGRIEELEVDLKASLATEEADDYVFTARGTKGSARITATCVTRDDGREEVVAGSIQLESGEVLSLFPGDKTLARPDD